MLPLIRIAGVFYVPATAKLAQKAAQEEDAFAMILPVAMGANISGVITSTVAAGIFVATIPGQIIEVNVKEGDQVKLKEILGKLEAMKMEQPIPSTKEGIVAKVNVAPGDKVKSGDVMFVID